MLRALLLLLTMMNLGVGAWWALHRSPIHARLPALDANVPPLVLLHEGPQAAAAEAALPVEAEELGEQPVCLSLGPLETPAELRRVMAALTPRVARIQFRETASTRLRGYRVFLPAAGSRAQALATARSLAARGINDYYVVTAGDQQDTVSLGIFRELANAEARQRQIGELGYQARIEARTEPAPQWWVDLAAVSGFDWRNALPDSALQATPVVCP